jgi:hypothetical protein
VRPSPAALVAVLALAGCGGSAKPVPTLPNGAPVPTAAEARARLESYIASDIRSRAVAAHIGRVVTVHSVRCVRRGRIHYVCRIRSSTTYRRGVQQFVADAFYDPRTEQAGYDIRP